MLILHGYPVQHKLISIFADALFVNKHIYNDATHERRGRKWVAAGSAWYVVFDGGRNWALELAISTRPARNKVRDNPDETVSIGGHTARLHWKVKRRGLPWQRHTVRYMILDFECPQSEREIKLEFSGWCPNEGFQEVLQSVKQLQCH